MLIHTSSFAMETSTAETTDPQTTSPNGFRMKSVETLTGFGVLTDKNLRQLKYLNHECFPVKYQDKYYQGLLLKPELTQFAYFNDIFVGAISVRYDAEKDGTERCYIMTLGVLESYRKCGIAIDNPDAHYIAKRVVRKESQKEQPTQKKKDGKST